MGLHQSLREGLGVIRDRMGPPDSRKQALRTLTAGLILGLGLVTVGTSLVHAQDGGMGGFFSRLFGRPEPVQPPVAQPERYRYRRYSALPDVRRIAAARHSYTPRPKSRLAIDLNVRSQKKGAQERRLTTTTSQSPMARFALGYGRQTVCVRTCDGYMFPIGRLNSDADIPVHTAACAAACPGADSKLFTVSQGGELDQAISLTGQPYLAAAFAKVYQTRRVENCACHPEGVALASYPLAQDATVRVGDVIATEDSANVITRLTRGKLVMADYRTAAGVSRLGRRSIESRVGRIARDARTATFRRTNGVADAETVKRRTSDAGGEVFRVAEIKAHPDGIDGIEPGGTSGRRAQPARRMVGGPYFSDY